jgi:hypothetical protein
MIVNVSLGPVASVAYESTNVDSLGNVMEGPACAKDVALKDISLGPLFLSTINSTSPGYISLVRYGQGARRTNYCCLSVIVACLRTVSNFACSAN